MLDAAFIFDLDGTLVDSEKEIRRVMNLCLAKLGCTPVSSTDFDTCRGLSMSRRLQMMFPHWSDKTLRSFRREFGQIYEDSVTRCSPYDGVDEVLHYLGDRAVIATNRPKHLVETALAELGWNDICFFAPNNRTEAKPSPILFCRAEQLLKQRFGDVPIFAVGDSPADEQGAQKAGLDFVPVGWGTVSACPVGINSWFEFYQLIKQNESGGLRVYLGS